MKRYVTIGFVLSGLVLLAWPYLAVGCVMIFAVPLRSAGEVAIRYTVVGAILLFPIVWGASGFFALRAVRRKAAQAGAAWTVVPYVWILLPIALIWGWDREHRPSWQGASDHVRVLHSPAEIANYVHDPSPEVRRSAYFTLGNLASRLAGPDQGAAVQLLLDGLRDSDRSVRSQAAFSLGQFGPAAEAAIGPLLQLAPSDSMVIGPLGKIAKNHPTLVVPTLVEIARHPNSNGATSLASANQAVRVLKLFPSEATAIVNGLSGSAHLPADPSGRASFFRQNYLLSWLETMTTLDPRATLYDPSLLEAPIVAVLQSREGGLQPKSEVLAIVGGLPAPTPAELNAVRLVAQTGTTAGIRAQAQKVLDAASRR